MAQTEVKNRKMAPEAYEKYKGNCYFFTKENDQHKTTAEILNDFRCQQLKTKNDKVQNRLYLKQNDKLFFVPQTKINECITNYNQYIDPERNQLNHKELESQDFLNKCSENTLNEVNIDSVSLLKYANDLSEQANVDENIKQFITELIEYTNINKEGIKELYNGAFIIIRDNGYFYNKFKCNGRECKTKLLASESSHNSLSKDPQYRIGQGTIYTCEDDKCNIDSSNNFFDLLIGTSPINYFYGDTWIQFEYANLLTIWNKWALHLVAYLKHRKTKKNIGPMGESEYVEYVKPLILNICKQPNCTNEPCEPIHCVTSNVDLKAESNKYLIDNNIVMNDYRIIKDLIQSYFSYAVNYGIFRTSPSEITMLNVKKIVENYIEKYEDYIEAKRDINVYSRALKYSETNKEIYLMCKKLLPYLNYLSENDNFKYNREQIIEIMFLIYYYINTNNTNYAELKTKIDERYSTTRQTAGKKNRRKTRSLKKNKRKTKKIRN